MKIVMLGHKRIPSREGGVEIVVEELATRMAGMGHTVTVYNRKGAHVAGSANEQNKYGKNYEYKGVRVKTVFTLPQKSLNAIVYSFFATLRACFCGADVIHFHAEGPCSMIPIAKIFGKKCVATIHGLDWQRAKWGGFATRFLLFGEKMAAKHADKVIVLSEGVRKYFENTYARETVVIPNGISRGQSAEAGVITYKYGLHRGKYMLFLARLVPEKGLHTLLEAYEKSKVKVPLVIAGGSSHSGEYCQEIEGRVEKLNAYASRVHTGQKVIMTGFVQGKELAELYSNAMLYILPSEIEGMPLSLLEAMSYGNICLTSDIPENTDVAEDYGFSFVTGDVDSLADRLAELCGNIDVLRNEGKYSRESVQKFILGKYSWDDVTKRTLELYKDISS